MKIYLAATYAQMFEMREVAEKLKTAGHGITAKWIWGDEEKMTKEAAASMDLSNVMEADIVMSYSLPPYTKHTGGGRHVEFGFGVILSKRMMIVGEKGEHIFHYLPDVEHYATLDEAIKAI